MFLASEDMVLSGLVQCLLHAVCSSFELAECKFVFLPPSLDVGVRLCIVLLFAYNLCLRLLFLMMGFVDIHLDIHKRGWFWVLILSH